MCIRDRYITPVCRHFSSLKDIFFAHICPFAPLNILQNKNAYKYGDSKKSNYQIDQSTTPYNFIPCCHFLYLLLTNSLKGGVFSSSRFNPFSLTILNTSDCLLIYIRAADVDNASALRSLTSL